MSLTDAANFYLRFEDHGNLQNYDGPGWYVSSTKSEGHLWAIEPQRISPARALAVAAAIDTALGMDGSFVAAVRRTNNEARQRALEELTRRETAVANPETAGQRWQEFLDE